MTIPDDPTTAFWDGRDASGKFASKDAEVIARFTTREQAAAATQIEWFRFHPATAVTGVMHDDVRGAFRELAVHLIAVLPQGPDKTLTIRALQVAMMQANACIANAGFDPAGAPLNPNSGANP